MENAYFMLGGILSIFCGICTFHTANDIKEAKWYHAVSGFFGIILVILGIVASAVALAVRLK